MSLLDKLVSADREKAITEVTIKQQSLFIEDKGVPALVGIEYMAQTIAAYSGNINREQGKAPQIGFLLGSRSYHSEIDYFLVNQTLTIEARPYYMGEEQLSIFDCCIRIDDKVYVRAMLNVYQPESNEDIIE